MAEKKVNSRSAEISFQTSSSSAPRMVAMACGKVTALDRVSFPVASIDVRGTGKSSVKGGKGTTSSLADYIEDFDSVLRATKAKRISLFGYSRGGYFTVAYALANPGNVQAMVLVEPALFTEREELLQRAQQAASGNGLESISTMLRYVQPEVGLKLASSGKVAKQILSNFADNQTLANEFTLRANNPFSETDLRSLKMPVLLIGGTASHAKSVVEKAAALIPDSSVWWINGANHLDLMSSETEKEIASVIDLFLQSHAK